MLRVEVDPSNLSDVFEQLDRKLQTRAVTIAVQGLIASIRENAAKGLDFEGKPFKPYSKRYAKVRIKANKPIDKVTLSFEGTMLNNLGLREGVITVREEDQDRAHGLHNGNPAMKLPARHFMGASEMTLERIAQLIIEELNKEL